MWSLYEWDLFPKADLTEHNVRFIRGVKLESHYPGYGSGEGFCLPIVICNN